MITVGIFGTSEDQEVQTLNTRLLNRGAETRIIDLSKFPKDLPLSITKDDIVLDGYSLFDLDVGYLRYSGATFPHFVKYDQEIKIVSETKMKALYSKYNRYVQAEMKLQKIRNSIVKIYSQCRMLVNSLEKNNLHRMKTYLLYFLKNNGIPVPNFMVGTSSRDLSDFARKTIEGQKEAVVKPLAGIYKTVLWSESGLKESPAIYQHYIEGETIRCYVLGGKLVASAVVLHEDGVDSSINQRGIRVINLPLETVRITERTAEILGLDFCGIDLVREDETYYIIDVNISPMFVNFSLLSFIDIPAQIAEYLIEHAGEHKKDKRRHVAILKQAKEMLLNDPEIRKMISPEN